MSDDAVRPGRYNTGHDVDAAVRRGDEGELGRIPPGKKRYVRKPDVSSNQKHRPGGSIARNASTPATQARGSAVVPQASGATIVSPE